jgi:hypothetical protein
MSIIRRVRLAETLFSINSDNVGPTLFNCMEGWLSYYVRCRLPLRVQGSNHALTSSTSRSTNGDQIKINVN